MKLTWRSQDHKRVFTQETDPMTAVQWWDSGVTVEITLQTVDTEENKTWKGTLMPVTMQQKTCSLRRDKHVCFLPSFPDVLTL